MTMSGRQYHETTCYKRNEMKGHAIDWTHQPAVFKSYPHLYSVPLPKVMTWPDVRLSEVLHAEAPEQPATSVTKDLLAKITILTHSLTAKARYGGVEFYYRSVASAGALYPFELYVGTRGAEGLLDGIYHHSVEMHALTRLRTGDIFGEMVAAGDLPPDRPPCVVFFISSLFFRSSWKYRDRAYRYNLLDSGHLAENLCLALKSVGLHYEMHYDFDDERINQLLGVDARREVCLALVPAWGKDPAASTELEKLEKLPASLAELSRVSKKEVNYAPIREIHSVSSEIVRPKEEPVDMLNNLGLYVEPGEELPDTPTWPEEMSYADAVFRRRSSRNFVSRPLPSECFLALMDSLCAGTREADPAVTGINRSVAVGFLAGNVKDLDNDFFMLDPENRTISQVASGPMIDEMTTICLGQDWLRRSALHVLFLANLQTLEDQWGPRGYRYAMLTAGLLGQRLYLAATAMRVGCCGIGAFYDYEAADLLGLNEHSRLLYLVSVGPIRKWSFE